MTETEKYLSPRELFDLLSKSEKNKDSTISIKDLDLFDMEEKNIKHKWIDINGNIYLFVTLQKKDPEDDFESTSFFLVNSETIIVLKINIGEPLIGKPSLCSKENNCLEAGTTIMRKKLESKKDTANKNESKGVPIELYKKIPEYLKKKSQKIGQDIYHVISRAAHVGRQTGRPTLTEEQWLRIFEPFIKKNNYTTTMPNRMWQKNYRHNDQ